MGAALTDPGAEPDTDTVTDQLRHKELVMSIVKNMFNPAFVAPDAREQLFTDYMKTDGPACSAYLALGALREPMSNEEIDNWGGECFFVEWVLMHQPMIQAVVKAAYGLDAEFPGVFLYEVVEEFGAWLRKQDPLLVICDSAKTKLIALSVEFFYPAASSTDDVRRHFADILRTDLAEF